MVAARCHQQVAGWEGVGWAAVAGMEAMVRVAEGGWVGMGWEAKAEKARVGSGERGCSRRGGQSRRQGVSIQAQASGSTEGGQLGTPCCCLKFECLSKWHAHLGGLGGEGLGGWGGEGGDGEGGCGGDGGDGEGGWGGEGGDGEGGFGGEGGDGEGGCGGLGGEGLGGCGGLGGDGLGGFSGKGEGGEGLQQARHRKSSNQSAQVQY